MIAGGHGQLELFNLLQTKNKTKVMAEFESNQGDSTSSRSTKACFTVY